MSNWFLLFIRQLLTGIHLIIWSNCIFTRDGEFLSNRFVLVDNIIIEINMIGRVHTQFHIRAANDHIHLHVGLERIHAQCHVGFLNIIMCVINIIISLTIQSIHIKNIIIYVINIIIFIITQSIDIKNIIICVIIILGILNIIIYVINVIMFIIILNIHIKNSIICVINIIIFYYN